MESKIVFLDIDGTIIDTPRGLMTPSYKTRYAVKNLIENGHKVVIASGRPHVLLSPDIISLGASGYLLCNGAYGECDGKKLFSYTFSDAQKEQIKSYTENVKDGVWFAEDQDIVLTSNMDNEVYYGFTRGWGMNDDQFLCSKENRPTYMMMTAFASEDDCAAFAEEFSNEYEVAKQYGFTSFDVSIKGITKGFGVTRFLELLGYSADDAYAFGDGTNDCEMMKNVANSFAMANGHELTKKTARYICDDVLEDGVYKALIQCGLIKPSIK